ncbi:ELMO domain-containing protein 2-like [Saccoglossus kowalevskii]|uniref:ELMO domain-containing protein 2-like n=1 Tax=Saccoglossus kowalevskii TaxID=10224 RepID=A0ABM0MGH7_SACKO|nr:PREDICTED: ELMO domain-containing protein 2-like [Saccoglossus kowalevskii]
MTWHQLWLYIYFSFLRGMIKWFLHKVTGVCELQRICSKYNVGAKRTKKIESCLKHSHTAAVKKALTNGERVDEAVANIMAIKGIHQDEDPQFGPYLTACLTQIHGYKNLLAEVEVTRKTPYNSENQEHENMLMQLWELLMPNNKLQSRITKQWSDIGFQGDDPKTDFRGMGMLGLNNLLFFSSQFNAEAKQTLSHSHHPKFGYSFAIVGINITNMAYTLMLNGTLRVHFYNLKQDMPNMTDFHRVYCYLLFEFDKFWLQSKPKDVMEFSRLRDKFQKKITKILKDNCVILEGEFFKE